MQSENERVPEQVSCEVRSWSWIVAPTDEAVTDRLSAVQRSPRSFEKRTPVSTWEVLTAPTAFDIDTESVVPVVPARNSSDDLRNSTNVSGRQSRRQKPSACPKLTHDREWMREDKGKGWWSQHEKDRGDRVVRR